MQDNLLTLKQVCDKVQLSPATIRRLRKLDKFPAPIEFSSQNKRYRESDINKFIANPGNWQ